MRPPALQPGDCVGVMAPSCWLPQEDLDTAKIFMEERGYKVFIHPQATARLNQSAGTAREKAQALNELFADPQIKAIFCARGGNRAVTMLELIDYGLVAANPKILMGYSDQTVLLTALLQKAGLIGFHGPMFREFPARESAAQTLEMLSGQVTEIDLPGSRVIHPGSAGGTAQGMLIGGNLSLLQTVAGTPYAPDPTGAILFIEDIGDHLSRYDRMLAHLRLAGWLEQISALIVGTFTDIKDDDERPFGFTLEDIVREHTRDLDIPILMDAPFGHGEDLPVFPFGCQAQLAGTKLTLPAPPVLIS